MKIIRHASLIVLATCFISVASQGSSAQQAQAAIIWDQSALGVDDRAHQIFPDFPNLSTWHVGDVFFGNAVTITDIHTFVKPFGLSPGATVPVEITLFPKTGSIPGLLDLPGYFGSGTAAYSGGGGVAEIHLSGLSIALAAGAYWIGITPVAPATGNGQTFHIEAAVAFGDQSAARNPGGGFGRGTDWIDNFGGDRFDDISLLIQGAVTPVDVPKPAAVPKPASL